MAREVEILVHIAAASTSKDDALYRQLASAYLDFEPARTIDLPAKETEAKTPNPEVALPPAELFSPQASFDNVWDNIRPPPADTSAQKNNSHNDGDSQTSWVQPPSEIADSMPNHNLSIPEFNSPGRILHLYLQTGGPPSELSEETGRRDLTDHEGGDNATTGLARGTDNIIERGAVCVATDPGEKSATSQHSVYEGGVDLSNLFAQGTNAIIRDGRSSGSDSVGEPNPSRNTIYEGSADFNTLLARGTNSILKGDCIPPTPTAAGAATGEPSTSDARYGTPPNVTTTGSRMDESHVSQTPSSPLRSKGVQPPLPSSSRSSKRSPVRSSDPNPPSHQSGNESFGITIPSTQLPERADSEPPSSKRHKPNPLRKRVHNLGRATSDVLPRGTASRASPILRHATLPPPDLTVPVKESIDWSRHTHLNVADPPPSTHRLGTRAPLKLETLMGKVGDRYRPTFPQIATAAASSSPPAMRAHERGYWLLPMADWPHDDRLAAWGLLGNFICRDHHAGWGTRACRDEGWAWLRLYGWEHIAGELYMLLYVATYQRLKAMEISWFDGKGEVLIVVKARRKKSAVEWAKVRREAQAQAQAQLGVM